MISRAATTDRPTPLFSALVGLTSLAVLLQAVWAGVFLQQDGRRETHTTALDVHNIGGQVATALALGAALVGFVQLRSRKDLWVGAVVLAVLLLVEVTLGTLLKGGKNTSLTVVHVPLAMLIMALSVWLPVRGRAAR